MTTTEFLVVHLCLVFYLDKFHKSYSFHSIRFTRWPIMPIERYLLCAKRTLSVKILVQRLLKNGCVRNILSLGFLRVYLFCNVYHNKPLVEVLRVFVFCNLPVSGF